MGDAHLYDLERPESAPSRFPVIGAPWKRGRFSPDERWLILESLQGIATALVRLNPTPQQIRASRDLKPGSSKSDWLIGFGATGQRLLIRHGDGTLSTWDISGSKPRVVEPTPGDLELEEVSDEGDWLLFKGKDSRRVLRPTEDVTSVEARLAEDRDRIDAVAVSEDRKWALTGQRDKEQKNLLHWRLWNLEQPEQESVVLRGHRGPITALALSPDERRILSGGTDGSVRIWRLWQPAVESHLRLEPIIELARRIVGRKLTQDERRRYQLEEPPGHATDSP